MKPDATNWLERYAAQNYDTIWHGPEPLLDYACKLLMEGTDDVVERDILERGEDWYDFKPSHGGAVAKSPRA